MMRKPAWTAIAVLAAALLVSAVRPADADYLGSFARSSPYMFEVEGATTMLVTIMSVTARGRLDIEELLVMDGNIVNTQSRTIPNNVHRLIFKLDNRPNNPGIFKITIGTFQAEIPVAGHEEVVFDAFDAP